MAVFFQLPVGKAAEELIPQSIFPDRLYPPGAYRKMIKFLPLLFQFFHILFIDMIFSL